MSGAGVNDRVGRELQLRQLDTRIRAPAQQRLTVTIIGFKIEIVWKLCIKPKSRIQGIRLGESFGTAEILVNFPQLERTDAIRRHNVAHGFRQERIVLLDRVGTPTDAIRVKQRIAQFGFPVGAFGKDFQTIVQLILRVHETVNQFRSGADGRRISSPIAALLGLRGNNVSQSKSNRIAVCIKIGAVKRSLARNQATKARNRGRHIVTKKKVRLTGLARRRVWNAVPQLGRPAPLRSVQGVLAINREVEYNVTTIIVEALSAGQFKSI